MSDLSKAPERVQLNARVSVDCRRKIKMDAASLDIGIDSITEAIITQFYAQFPRETDRKRIFVSHQETKVVGESVAVPA